MPPLTPQQRRIVGFRGRSLSVVGIAGSGKTTALVARAVALVHDGVPPEEILCLAPTRDAARLLREALAAQLPVPRSGPWARTPQSLAFEVVHAAAASRGESPVRLMTGSEQEQIIGELLAGHADGSGPRWPESIPPDVRALRGFRHELRDFVNQCAEYGVEPWQLDPARRAEWAAVAPFVEEYRRVVASMPTPLFAAAEMVAVAARVLRRDQDWPAPVRPVGHVLVDDVQELTESSVRLLAALASRGAVVIGFGDPDTATNEFRGGRPELAATLGERIGLAGEVITLDSGFRLDPAIAAALGRVTGAIGAARAGGQRRVLHGSDRVPDGVRVELYGSSSQADAAVARFLRRRHLVDGVPWPALAVVTRSASAAARLVRSLEQGGVPTRALGRPELFRENPATSPLLLAGAIATGVVDPAAMPLMELLGSYLVGMDAVAVRRLRRALRAEERRAGGRRTADELLAEAFSVPAGFATIDRAVVAPAERFSARLAAAKRAAVSATAEEILWEFWDGSGVAEQWRRISLAGGAEASAVSRGLDSVVALFAAARRSAEQDPSAAAADFFADQLERRVADDVITPAAASDVVWVGTPSQTIAREFDTVVIPDVQEGVWPDVRLRDTLLGANEIPSLAGAAGSGHESRRAVVHSELRLFARAMSRARNRLLVTAVQSEEESPSGILGLVDPDVGDVAVSAVADDPAPYTLRGMVAQIRRDAAVGDPEARRTSAGALAVLSRAGVGEAGPDSWYGMVPVSTIAPIHDLSPDNPMRISPSTIERFETCPLAWFLDRAGANDAAATAGIGTIVHSAFERASGMPTFEELAALVDQRWGELDFEAAWEAGQQRARVDIMLRRIVGYLSEAAAAGRRRLAAEIRFADPGTNYLLRGSIDRIDIRDEDGTVTLVDLKTGRSKPGKAEMGANPQLASYQLAVADGLPGAEEIPPGVDGARIGQALLLYVGTADKDYVEREQPPLDPDALEGFRLRLSAVADGMAAPRFTAHVQQHCTAYGHAQCAIQIVPAVHE